MTSVTNIEAFRNAIVRNGEILAVASLVVTVSSANVSSIAAAGTLGQQR